jgi:HAE1 family hydrophobic/amphiphilic exporter-1
MKQSSASFQWLFSIFAILVLVLAFAPGSSLLIAQQSDSSSKTTVAADDKDLPPLPLSPIEKAEKDGSARKMSLNDITKLALQNNLDIAIQDTNEQAIQFKIQSAKAAYDPTLTGNGSWGKRKGYNTTYTDQSSTSTSASDSASWGANFSQKIKTGGNYSVRWSGGRTDSNTNNTKFNPSFNNSATFSITQPLLRNFRIDDTRKNLKVVNLNSKITDSQFKKSVSDTIFNIQNQYWTLVSAIKDYEIKRNSVRLGQITLRDNIKRRDVGTLAPIGVIESEYDLENRKLNLTSSEEQILQQENALRQMISNDRNSDIWNQVIIPTDTPDLKEYKVDLETAITTALKNRPEMEQSDINLKISELNQLGTRNNKKWLLDLTFQYGGSGQAGPQSYRKDFLTGQFIKDLNGNLIPESQPALIGGFLTSLKTIFTQNVNNWQIGFNVTAPLWNRSIDAQIAQDMISYRQQQLQRKNQEQSILVEIRNAVQRLRTNLIQLDTAKKGLELSKQQLDGEVKRFDAGLSENFKVLDRQNQLASQEKTYLDNLIQYKKSIIDLQKKMYTLLESNDFDLAKGSSTKVPNLK